MSVVLQDFSWKRMIDAVEAVRERALRATAALQRAGIPYAVAGGNAVAARVARVDRADGNSRDAVHLIFAGEKVRPTHSLLSADVTEVELAEDYTILTLEALVRMILISFAREDRMHFRDLLDVGLIDSSWLPRLAPEHATRLQQLIDDPDG